METYLGTPRTANLTDEINEAVMRCTIRNIRILLEKPYDNNARSELMWASAMAENGILKIGKLTDFQAHQIEHQLGAYTDCNHGRGLAVLQPVLYRHMVKDNIAQFARLAREVWQIKGSDEEETAVKGVEALVSFVKEMGLPTTLQELGIRDLSVLRKVADTSNLTSGCCKQFDREELYEILKECL